MTATDDDKRLRKTFWFTQDDLLANRQERMTQQQRTVLEEKAKSFLISSSLLCVLVSIFLMSIVGRYDVVMLVFSFALVAFVGGMFIWLNYQNWRDDINADSVEVLCGPVFLEIREGGRYRPTSYKLNIGSETFTLTQAQLLVLDQGHDYCVYYAPKTKTLFSVEEMPSSLQEQAPQTLSQQRFGAHAQNYVTSQTHAKGADLDRLLEIAQPRPYWHVLDVATGGGHTALKFAPHVARVVASDLTPQMLKAAEAHIAGKGVTNVEFREARAEDLPFDSNTFDLVTCRIAPHHFDDVAKFVKEAARVVRPGGLVLVQDQQMPEDPVVAGYVEAFEKLRDPSHNHALTETEWRAAFAAAGLTLEHVESLTKSHSFEEWTTTQSVLPSTKACLEALIAAAPPAAVAWLQPRDFGTPEATFVNVHIILAGQKSG